MDRRAARSPRRHVDKQPASRPASQQTHPHHIKTPESEPSTPEQVWAAHGFRRRDPLHVCGARGQMRKRVVGHHQGQCRCRVDMCICIYVALDPSRRARIIANNQTNKTPNAKQAAVIALLRPTWTLGLGCLSVLCWNNQVREAKCRIFGFLVWFERMK